MPMDGTIQENRNLDNLREVLLYTLGTSACRITAITSAFQAEDVGSTPIGR